MASSVGFSKIKAASKKSIPWFLMLAAFFSSSHSKLSSAMTSGIYNTHVCTHHQDSRSGASLLTLFEKGPAMLPPHRLWLSPDHFSRAGSGDSTDKSNTGIFHHTQPVSAITDAQLSRREGWGDQFWSRRAAAYTEVLSRFLVRAEPDEALQWFHKGLSFASDERWRWRELFEPLGHLLQRSLSAVPPRNIPEVLADVMAFPLPDETALAEHFGHDWPDSSDRK